MYYLISNIVSTRFTVIYSTFLVDDDSKNLLTKSVSIFSYLSAVFSLGNRDEVHSSQGEENLQKHQDIDLTKNAMQQNEQCRRINAVKI